MKEIMKSQEAANFMGISMSQLYKLTRLRQIPRYKPTGKIMYFNRLELEEWMQSNRVATEAEISQKAVAYGMKGGKA